MCLLTTNYLNEILLSRGHVVNKSVTKKRINKEQNDNKRFFLNVPFIDDKTNKILMKSLKPLGVRINVSHKSRHLKNIIGKVKSQEINHCNLKKCKIKNKMCNKTRVVYAMICQKCEEQFIGSTKRKVHQRVMEHMIQSSSLVFKHTQLCHGEWKVKILYENQHVQNVRYIMESMLIKSMKPKINKKDNLFINHIVLN